MTSTCKKLLLLLLCCALPYVAGAAETTTAPDGLKPVVQPLSPPAMDAVPPPNPAETPKAGQTLRLGYADIARIGTESDLGKASRSEVEAKQKKLQTQIDSRSKQLEKQKAAIEARFATFTPQQKAVKGKEFQKKVEEFQKFAQNAEKELQTLQEGVTKTLYEAIGKAAGDYGKSNGLALVVVKRELLYLASGVDAVDVTDGIIKLLNGKGTK